MLTPVSLYSTNVNSMSSHSLRIFDNAFIYKEIRQGISFQGWVRAEVQGNELSHRNLKLIPSLTGQFLPGLSQSTLGLPLCHCVMPCLVVLCFALLCFALLCFALLCFALLCFALLCFALLCFALLCFAWLGFDGPDDTNSNATRLELALRDFLSFS